MWQDYLLEHDQDYEVIATHLELFVLSDQQREGPRRTTPPGIIFDAIATRSESEPLLRMPIPRNIILRRHLALPAEERPTWGGWTTRCFVCTKHLALESHCPCGLGQHDHCESHAILGLATGSDAGTIFRVCVQCSRKLMPPVIVQLQWQRTPDQNGIVASTLSGRQIANFDMHALPSTLAELGNLIIDEYDKFFEPENPNAQPHARLAADGYL